MIKHASGLTTNQAQKLLGQYGFNEINSAGATSVWNILWRQIKGNFIIYLLVGAMIISFAVGKGLTSYTILTVILMVIGTSFVQEYKAEKAIEYLKKMYYFEMDSSSMGRTGSGTYKVYIIDYFL